MHRRPLANALLRVALAAAVAMVAAGAPGRADQFTMSPRAPAANEQQQQQQQQQQQVPDVFAEVEMTAGGGVSAAKEAPESLDCVCEEYNCDCRKECLCRITEQPFAGKQQGGGDKPKAAAKAGAKDAVTFKCGCDFGSTNFEMNDKQGLDCDCNAAKCTCDKRCTCKSNGGGAAAAGGGAQKFRDAPRDGTGAEDVAAMDGDDAAAAAAVAERRPERVVEMAADGDLTFGGAHST